MKEEYNFNNIPTNWDDITLNKYIEIQRAFQETKTNNDNNGITIKVLSKLTNIEEEELNDLPSIVGERLLSSMHFLNEPLNIEPNNTITINNEQYSINIEEKLRFGEYVDAQTIIEDDPLNIQALLAILCRKPNEQYDNNFKTNKLSERIELFGNLPILKVYPLWSFFAVAILKSPSIINKFSNHLIDQARDMIGTIENFQENGDGKRYFTKSQMKTLSTLKEALNSI